MASQNIKYIVTEKGAPLKEKVTPIPTDIGPNEVLIRLKAIAVNPADVKMAYQGHRVTSWPLVPGFDGSGIVDAVGDQVRNFSIRDEVLANFIPGDRAASFQNFAVVQEESVAKKPITWSFEEAATLGVCYYTALAGLGIGLKTPLPFLKDGPATGFVPSSALVLGGSSALGAATIQLLRLALPDCTVLTTSSPKHHSRLTNTLGAHRAFDRTSTTLVADVKEASPASRGVDAIIDTVGAGATEKHVFETFDPQGPKKYAQVWTGDDEIKVPSGVDSVLFRSRDLSQIQGVENMMGSLQNLLEEGKYKLPLPVHIVGGGLGALQMGLEKMLKGVSGEKLVLVV
ncbi:putative alcohol dehydrogenase [Hypoxylon trugodes]|uniref:putative alcohol dehydrogenase n=1 Tax=Hypoxylon trugodes TaxID=326681 RepID=UPI00219497FE|nr:putative alcohol dehydrogenase [Hypoxylon trugodes]KAI1386077.1 putative alcohol dehydrogenase [Hypoxylon trugodes]